MIAFSFLEHNDYDDDGYDDCYCCYSVVYYWEG